MPKSDKYINGKGEQIDFTLEVFTRPNLRDEQGEMLMYQGKLYLEIMFDRCTIDEKVRNIHMEYPERWCNLIEQRAIPDRMLVCFPNLEKITIRTHSVYTIQCVHAEHIRIYDNETKSKYQEEGYNDLSIRYCDLPNKFEGLQVFGG